MVALISVTMLFLNDVAWTFQLSGTYSSRVEHVGSIPDAAVGGDRLTGESSDADAHVTRQPVRLPAVDSGTFHSSYLSLRPKLRSRTFRPRPVSMWFARSIAHTACSFHLRPAVDSYPGQPPFDSYYRWVSNPAVDFQVASGRWDRFLGCGPFPNADLIAGTKSTPFGTGATLGSDIINDILAIHWSGGNFDVIGERSLGPGNKYLSILHSSARAMATLCTQRIVCRVLYP